MPEPYVGPPGRGLGDLRRRPGRRSRPRSRPASVTRSAIRRLVLARISGDTTPEGRWVARMRWMPSDRPRWAMFDQAGDEVGQLPDHRRELVDDDQQPGQRRGAGRSRAARMSGSPRCPWRRPRPGCARAGSARRDSDASARSTRCGVEVGDHADGVRQLHAVLERAAALVVDEHERHLVGPVGDRQRGDDRLQQLGLAGAGRAGDQPVRPVPARCRCRTGPS